MEHLPPELIHHICEWLDVRSVWRLGRVNKQIRAYCPAWIMCHKYNFSACIKKINEIKYITGVTDWENGDSKINWHMVGKTTKIQYSLREFKSRKTINVYHRPSCELLYDVYEIYYKWHNEYLCIYTDDWYKHNTVNNINYYNCRKLLESLGYTACHLELKVYHIIHRGEPPHDYFEITYPRVLFSIPKKRINI